MNIKTLSIVFIVVLSFSRSSAQEILLEGRYAGKNLFILNPSVDSGKFCVYEILINNNPSKDAIRSNSFEIDFSLTGLVPGSQVTVLIRHTPECQPIVINPEVLKEYSDIRFTEVKVNRQNILTWKITGDTTCPSVGVEQFRWDKWILTNKIQHADTACGCLYVHTLKPHSGQNVYRLRATGSGEKNVYSELIRCRGPVKEIIMINKRISDRIDFSDETMFEIYDERGNQVDEGFGKEVNIRDLQKGRYYINYDNKTETFMKK